MALSPGVAAQRSLALWEQPAVSSGLAFESLLRRCRLDYAPDSLRRIDAFLDALRSARHPQASEFMAVAAQQQLVSFLCFYSGEVLGRALGHAPLWLNGAQAMALAPQALAQMPPLHRALCARFGTIRARDGANLFLPMTAVCGRLFAPADERGPGLAEATTAWWPSALQDATVHAQPLPPRTGQPWPPVMSEVVMQPATVAAPPQTTTKIEASSAPPSPAAAHEDPESLHQQALRHLRGDGAPRDPALARVLWGRAAVQGHLQSQHSLGLALARGLGGPVDQLAALEHFRRAGEQGLLEAQLQAAQMYLQHDGVAPDLLEAERWLRLAAAQGSEKAHELIVALEFDRPSPPTLRERYDQWIGRVIDRMVDGIAELTDALRTKRKD